MIVPSTILVIVSFFLNLTAYLVYNPDLSPYEQDYVYDMIAWSYSVFIASVYTHGGYKVLINPDSYIKCVYKLFFMYWFFSCSFAAIREQFTGLNKIIIPLEHPVYFGSLFLITALIFKTDFRRVAKHRKYR